MALDIHVMPLWKFWAGEYTTAMERFAERTGTPMSRIGRQKALYPPQEARDLARGLRLWVEQETGTENAWEDDGAIVFSEQFQFEGIHAVRAYAAHREDSQEPFEITEGFERYPALRKRMAGVPTEFPHLIHHEDNQGLYVPVDFELPLMGGPFSIGSSVQLMMDLAKLRRNLGAFPDYEEWRVGSPMDEPHPGIAWVKHGIAFLYQACWRSVQSRVPIIFDG